MARRPAKAVLHVSPQTDMPTNDAAAGAAIRAARLNPRFLVASQNKPDDLAPKDWTRSIHVKTPAPARTWGFADYFRKPSQQKIDRAADLTLARIGEAFDGDGVDDAGRVLLDEVRLNTAGAAAEVFRRLPKQYRGKVLAYLVGGPKVDYDNQTFKDANLLAAMRRAQVQPVMESYGAPGAGQKQARGVANNYRRLVQAGLSPSISVGGLDRYNNPDVAAWGSGDRLGNAQLANWVSRIRQELPNAPIGAWPLGTLKEPVAPGRANTLIKAAQRRAGRRGVNRTP